MPMLIGPPARKGKGSAFYSHMPQAGEMQDVPVLLLLLLLLLLPIVASVRNKI